MLAYLHSPAFLLGVASKTVIVTGGANDIEAQTVRCFHSHGANVVIADFPSSTEASVHHGYRYPDSIL
jgi:NAD(P)-dependent dehydrogenase (short-subunit alcohol dehydrogenase family)